MPSPTEQLTPDELAFHQNMVLRTHRIEVLRAEIAATEGALHVWSDYLAGRYRLADGDRVESDGTIVRGEGIGR